MLSKCPVQHLKNRPLHNTLALDVDTVQEACIQHEKALCEWFRLPEPVQAERGSGNTCSRRAKFWLAESFYPNPTIRWIVFTKIDKMDSNFF